MFLRLELLGHYLEIGATDQPADVAPVVADAQYPMTVSAQPLGFRIIGPDEYLEDDSEGMPHARLPNPHTT